MQVRLLVCAAVLFWSIGMYGGVFAQSGEQVINGTRVFTQIDQARGVATFSNVCGSQTLTQRQLQAGAIPDQLIPCPRHTAPTPGTRPSKPFDASKDLNDAASSILKGDLAQAVKYDRAGEQYFAQRNYDKAQESFFKAAMYYRLVQEQQKADKAAHNHTRAICYGVIDAARGARKKYGPAGGLETFEFVKNSDCKTVQEAWPLIDIEIAKLRGMEAKQTTKHVGPVPNSAPTNRPPGDASGSSRWLPPNSPNGPQAATKPTSPPLKEIHLGNKGNETGAKDRPTHGLSPATRQIIDALRADPVRRKEYLAGLSAADRRKAENYLNDPQTVPGAKLVPKTNDECTRMLERLRPRAPNQEWIRWHMEREQCRPDGTPMSLEELRQAHRRMIDRMPDYLEAK